MKKYVRIKNVGGILKIREEFLDFVGSVRRCFIARGGIKGMLGRCISISVVIIREMKRIFEIGNLTS